MKKILFLATVVVAGAATVGFAQSSKGNDVSVAGNFSSLNYQDTTKPVKDSIPQKKDSTTFKY